MSLAWLEQHHCLATRCAACSKDIKLWSAIAGDFNLLGDLWQIISLLGASVLPSVTQAGYIYIYSIYVHISVYKYM